MASPLEGEIEIEKDLGSPTSNQNALGEPSPTPPALVLSNSGKRIDQAGKKKYVKQVTGRHNDTELHLAAQKGDLVAVKQILDGIDSQMVGMLSGAEFDNEVAEIRASVVNEVNELGETALFTAADKGHLEVVKELLKYSNKETLTKKNRSLFDPLHVAASQGHHAIVQVLLDHDPELSKTVGPSNATPLITAASRGHTAVVNELLAKDCTLVEISRSNGKNALHLAARQGHVDILKALLDKDPQLARRTDKKGQTALHMAVKGVNCEVVKLLLDADAAIVMLPDKNGNTALHAAIRILRYVKRSPGTGLLYKDHGHTEIVGYTDADWAGCPWDRRSTSGYCILLGGNLVSWKSKKQNVVARSSAEAEYRAMALGTCELIWVKQLLIELKLYQPSPMKLICDNQAALHIASNPVFHERTKHIEVDCHFIREKIASGDIVTTFVGSNDQLADILTKSLRGPRIEFISSKLGAFDLYAPA